MTASVIIAAAVAMAAAQPEGTRVTDPAHWAEVSADALTGVIGDNEPMGSHHRKRYNGVFALATPALAESPFVPAYAGLNL